MWAGDFLVCGLILNFVNDATSVVVECDKQRGIRICRHLQESPGWLGTKEGLFYDTLGIGGLWVAGLDAFDRVFVVERADGKFLHAGGMDAVVLPMAVAAEDEDILDFFLLQPREKRVRLRAETRVVRVVVGLAGAVGADHGCWRD